MLGTTLHPETLSDQDLIKTILHGREVVAKIINPTLRGMLERGIKVHEMVAIERGLSVPTGTQS